MILPLIFFCLIHRTLSSACFIQSPWPNIRSIVDIVDPCVTIDNCERACLANSLCDGFVYTSRCAMLSVDSGIAQLCLSRPATLWQRQAICGGAKTTTASQTTTYLTNTSTSPTTTSANAATATTTTVKTTTTTRPTTATATTTTTTSATTTTPSTISPCGPLIYEPGPTCTGSCPAPTINTMRTTCAYRFRLWVNGEDMGNLTCFGTKWIYKNIAYHFPVGSKVYCQQMF